MKKNLFLFILALSSLAGLNEAGAQCLAQFNVYQDTTAGAPLHTYLGNNTSQPANFLGVDTVNFTYTWLWGDGSSTTAPYPTHTYAAAGNYTITLWMNSVVPAMCNDSMTIVATINKNAAIATLTIINPYLVASAKDVAETKTRIYPNPVNDRINLEGLDQATEVSIFSIDGRSISKPGIVHNSIAVSDLKAGVYFLKVVNRGGVTQTLSFIKN